MCRPISTPFACFLPPSITPISVCGSLQGICFILAQRFLWVSALHFWKIKSAKIVDRNSRDAPRILNCKNSGCVPGIPTSFGLTRYGGWCKVLRHGEVETKINVAICSGAAGLAPVGCSAFRSWTSEEHDVVALRELE